MTDRIFSIHSDGKLVPMEARDYDSEDLLQKLLARYPDLLAGSQMDPEAPRRWLLIGREFQIPDEERGSVRWSLDHLFVDQDGTPTLIEVKRSTDGRLRREVVGQMLDYASNLAAWIPLDEIQRVFQERCAGEGLDPLIEIGRLLELPPDANPEQLLWQRIQMKLQAGAIRLVFVADEIPRELRRVVEFLNGQMESTEVLAVEVRQYVGEGLQTLVPKVIGTVAAADRKSMRRYPPDTEATFGDRIRIEAGEQAARLWTDLRQWIEPLVTSLFWGKGSMIPVLAVEGGRERGGANCYYFAIRSNGKVEMQFGYLKGKPGFRAETDLEAFLEKVNAIPGIKLPADSFSRFPSFPIEKLSQPVALRAFKSAVEWALGRTRSESSA